MKCSYCEKVISNPGSLASHEKYCQGNPNRVDRDPERTGAKKGNIPWNKGFRDPEKALQRSIEIIEANRQLSLHEATARKHAKRYLIHKNGHRCEICGVQEWMGQPAPLVIDHIDGDSSNNSLENFQIVCCNCDAQLPTYKSKNKKGRMYDREYYRTHK